MDDMSHRVPKEGFGQRLVRSPGFWVSSLLGVGLGTGGIVELLKTPPPPSDSGASLYTRTPEPASEAKRRQLIDGRDAITWDPPAGAAPCPYEVLVPARLHAQPAGWGRTTLGDKLELVHTFGVARSHPLDVVPTVASGVGPFKGTA